MGHGDGGRGGGGEVGGREGDVADVAARQLERAGQEVEVDVGGAGDAGAQVGGPQAAAVVVFGQGEVDDGVEAAGEGLVGVGAQVGGQDRETQDQEALD